MSDPNDPGLIDLIWRAAGLAWADLMQLTGYSDSLLRRAADIEVRPRAGYR